MPSFTFARPAEPTSPPPTLRPLLAHLGAHIRDPVCISHRTSTLVAQPWCPPTCTQTPSMLPLSGSAGTPAIARPVARKDLDAPATSRQAHTVPSSHQLRAFPPLQRHLSHSRALLRAQQFGSLGKVLLTDAIANAATFVARRILLCATSASSSSSSFLLL